jgi:hypothetical protein
MADNSRPIPHDKPKPAKPDARPMRVVLGVGGVAALSAIAAAIVAPPQPDAVVIQPQTVVMPDPNAADAQAVVSQPTPDPTAAQVVRPIQYIQLQPGQTPPPGATVIPATAPTPITVVVSVPVSGGGTGTGTRTSAGGTTPKPAPRPTPIIIKTTQSGKVVP